MLTIGLIGEMIYSGGGLFGIISANNWGRLAVIMTLTHVFRLLQVIKIKAYSGHFTS